jgi:hypothetical protein
LLVLAQPDPATTGATLLELAQLGVLRIDDGVDDRSAQTVVLVDAALATRRHHRALLKGLFPLLKPGESRVLRRGRKDNLRLLGAQSAMTKALYGEVAERGWYRRMPPSGRLGRLLRRTRLVGWGRLTRAGDETVDEVLGFRQYFATLEPGQATRAELLGFLPWAMMFGLHERWDRLAAGVDVDDDEPVAWWSAVGMFRLGRFRRGLAGFTVDVLVADYIYGSGYTDDGVDPTDIVMDPGNAASGFDGGSAGDGHGGGGGDSW